MKITMKVISFPYLISALVALLVLASSPAVSASIFGFGDVPAAAAGGSPSEYAFAEYAPEEFSTFQRYDRSPMDRSTMVRFGKRAPMDRSSMVRFGKRAPMDRSSMVRFGKRAPMDRSSMVRFGKRTADVFEV